MIKRQAPTTKTHSDQGGRPVGAVSADRHAHRTATGLNDPPFFRIAEPGGPDTQRWPAVRADSLRSPVRNAAVPGDRSPRLPVLHEAGIQTGTPAA